MRKLETFNADIYIHCMTAAGKQPPDIFQWRAHESYCSKVHLKIFGPLT